MRESLLRVEHSARVLFSAARRKLRERVGGRAKRESGVERCLQRAAADGTRAACPTRNQWLATLLVIVLAASGAIAQDDEHPPAKKPGVRITFLPPPLEGTLSLGIYDKAGKLVRTLHREATEKEFVVGLNGFITSWDGNDDGGHPLPAGKYFARGYALGEITVEGVAMHGNDWITSDDSPRIKQLSVLTLGIADDLLVRAQKVDGKLVWLRCDREEKVQVTTEADTLEPPTQTTPGAAATIPAGGDAEHPIKQRSSEPGPELTSLKVDGVTKRVAAAFGAGGSLWVIDESPTGTAVKQFRASGELQRELAIATDEPKPMALAPSKKRDVIFLLEKNASIQRVRGLALETPAAPPTSGEAAVSTWKEFFSKSIHASDDFAAVADKLGREKPFAPEAKIRVRLVPNELLKGASTEVDVQVTIDREGAYLKASDGLLLKRITETPNLKWAVMGREGSRTLTIFQSDGAVVEEFKARKLANMMAFDAGEYEWKPAGN